jgi:hypothetical protein
MIRIPDPNHHSDVVAKSMLDSFKVQNKLQGQSGHVKVYKGKYESYEKMPVNTVNTIKI